MGQTPNKSRRLCLLGMFAILCSGPSDPSSAVPPPGPVGGRRVLLAGAASGLAVAFQGTPAEAFDNSIKKIKGMRTAGPQPTEIELLPRTDLDGKIGLKSCSRLGANCLSTTYNNQVELGGQGILPWEFTGKTPSQAMKEVLSAVKSYKPGQDGIDGGGFEIQKVENNYIYVQYEALKMGYLDDAEFAIAPETQADAQSGKLLVRSSSRLGKYDQGANGLRLEAIASTLRGFGGWKAEISPKTNPQYWTYGNCGFETVREKHELQCAEATRIIEDNKQKKILQREGFDDVDTTYDLE